MSDEDYRQLLQSLNIKQKQFFTHVVHWIKTKDAPLYAFLYGGAGVGKSVVIRALYQTLYRILNLKEGRNADDITVLLCAYTGMAAFNIGGATISSAFKQRYKQSNQTLTADSVNTFRSKYRNLSVVIIDEISMVSNSLMNFIDQRLQELNGNRIPFGGVSIIAVGDLYQLRPIQGDWIFKDMTRDAAALARNLWKDHFTVFELTEIMRQKVDLEFAELLNRLRKNSLTEADKLKLHECKIDTDLNEHNLNVPHLFAEKYFMHRFNDKIISRMQSETVTIPCHDTVVTPKLSKDKQNEAIKKLSTDPNVTANLHCSLVVVVGMIYDLCVNVNVDDGLANGASCKVKFVEYKQSETVRPSIVWVEFDNQKVGMETRVKFQNRGFYHSHIHKNWTPVFDVERSFTYNKKTFQRIQFPLQPSAGRTVHRAQGSTLEKITVDLSQQRTRKVPHLHYVALSRVKSLKGLRILNFNEGALSLDNQVEEEMARLHQNCALQLCYTPLESIDSDSQYKVAFNNCRSLHLHFSDIKHDQGLLSCHVFALAESRLCHVDDSANYSIEGYNLIRNDQLVDNSQNRPVHGLALYIKTDTVVTSASSFSSNNLEFTYINTTNQIAEMQIVMLYKAPSMSGHDFLEAVREHLLPHLNPTKQLVIMGDFNFDVKKHHGMIKRLCTLFGCKMLINEPTTDNMSVLDLVFSNMDCESGTIETYWSDHKIVYFYTKS